MTSDDLEKEFQRQVSNLIQKGYLEAANLAKEEFLKLVEPLKEKLSGLDLPAVDLDNGTFPFVIVIKSDLVSTEKAMGLVEREGKTGISKLFPHEPKDFQVIEAINIPESPIYLLMDIDRGKETLNVTPADAFRIISGKHRLPLTIDEGVAIITQYPQFLMKNNCFSLLASRHKGDKRVPAIWINAQKHPNLGWCWDGNPHTWLGSASAKNRIGVD